MGEDQGGSDSHSPQAAHQWQLGGALPSNLEFLSFYHYCQQERLLC